MRKLIYGINLTLDGCCDHTKANPYEDVHRYFTRLLRESDAVLYGRITYQLMVPFWPDMARSGSAPTESMREFAEAFDSVRSIIVFSRTLDPTFESEKATILRGNLADEIAKLKQQPGKDILLGGVDLPSQLVELDLIDEYRFVIQPIIVGEGRRLFNHLKLAERLDLKLADTETFPSGCVALRYVKW